MEDGRILTEVTAILYHLNEQGAGPALPRSGLDGTEALTWCSIFSSGVHPPFSVYIFQPRISDDEQNFPRLKQDARKRAWAMLSYVESRLSQDGTVLNQGPGLLDSYAFVFYFWGLKSELPVRELTRYTRLAQAQVKRPAVIQALVSEGLGHVPQLILQGALPTAQSENA
jgi:glutathione S-transferase